MKKTLLTVASGIVAFVLVIGFWILGLFTGNGELIIYIPIAAVCGAVIILAILLNVILTHRLSKKFNSMKIQEIYDFTDKLKSDVENDYSAAEKKVKNTITLAYVYVLSLIAVISVLCFALGAMKLSEGAGIVPVLLCSYTMWGLVDIFFIFPEGSASDDGYEIPQKGFPLLYETVRRAALKTGCKKTVKLYISPTGVFVGEQRGKVVIHIGYAEFALFTSEELYNVMLHEFAHVINADSQRGALFSREEQRWNEVSEGGNPLTFLSNLLTTFPSASIILKTDTYHFFAARHHEIQADESVKKLGSPQNYANALAKSGMLVKFRDMPCRELEYDFFIPEKCTADYAKQEYETFLMYRKRYAERWDTQFKLELPARVDSHPTFKMRLENIGCESYDAYTEESNPDYVSEQKKYISLCDRVFNERQSSRYGDYRETFYLDPKKIMDEYDGNENLSDGKLLTALQTFARIDGDKAITIAEKLLKNNPNNAKVNYIMGEILFFRYDRDCIEHLYTASKDALYTDNAMEYIGRFALLSGDEKLLEEYRKNMPEVMQKAKDEEDNLVINSKTEICGCGFTDDEKSSIYAGVTESAGDILSSLYIGVIKSKTGEEYYAAVPVFNDNYDKSKFGDYMSAIDNFFSLFFDKKFIFIDDGAPAAKLIKQKDNTKIY